MASRIRQSILAAAPEDGSPIGNKSLFKKVRGRLDDVGQAADDETIEAERSRLIADGVLGKGRGRGGSVYLRQAVGAANGDGGAGIDNSNQDGAYTSLPKEVEDDAQYGNYRHPDQATQRPDVGLQDQFPHARGPKTYRYDSSLAPELAWDENAGRDFAGWLLGLIADVAEQDEAAVFDPPPQWRGNGERFESLRQCVARLQSLSQPFLNWAGFVASEPIHVVVAREPEGRACYVVTAYSPNPGKWSDDLKTRRQ